MTARASKSARAHKRAAAPPPCQCERLPFPHRRTLQCDAELVAVCAAIIAKREGAKP